MKYIFSKLYYKEIKKDTVPTKEFLIKKNRTLEERNISLFCKLESDNIRIQNKEHIQIELPQFVVC
jgi:hypothetical protein